MAENALTIETTHLGEADVHVWCADLDTYGASELAWAALDAAEVGRAQRFRRPVDRDRFVAAHAIVRRILGAYLGRAPSALRFAIGAYGKPSLDVRGNAPALCFNLSHSHDVLLLGVARGDIGIDVERIAGDVEYNELAALVFSAVEQRALAATPAARASTCVFHRLDAQRSVHQSDRARRFGGRHAFRRFARTRGRETAAVRPPRSGRSEALDDAGCGR